MYSSSEIAFVLLFIVIPVCLITYCLYNKRSVCSWYFIIFGCFLITFPLSINISPAIGSAICYLLSIFGISAFFSDTSKLSVLLTLILVFIEYKIYKVYVYWESLKYTDVVTDIINFAQTKQFPDCRKEAMKAFRNRILYHWNKHDGKNDPEYAVKQLYYAITDILSGDTYYSAIDNKLTDEGNQLLNIRIACVNHLAEKGVISEDKKDEYYYSRNAKF